MPKADCCFYSSPIAYDEFDGIFVGIIENEKNIDQPMVTVTGYNSIPAALNFEAYMRYIVA